MRFVEGYGVCGSVNLMTLGERNISKCWGCRKPGNCIWHMVKKTESTKRNLQRIKQKNFTQHKKEKKESNKSSDM